MHVILSQKFPTFITAKTKNKRVPYVQWQDKQEWESFAASLDHNRVSLMMESHDAKHKKAWMPIKAWAPELEAVAYAMPCIFSCIATDSVQWVLNLTSCREGAWSNFFLQRPSSLRFLISPSCSGCCRFDQEKGPCSSITFCNYPWEELDTNSIEKHLCHWVQTFPTKASLCLVEFSEKEREQSAARLCSALSVLKKGGTLLVRMPVFMSCSLQVLLLLASVLFTEHFFTIFVPRYRPLVKEQCLIWCGIKRKDQRWTFNDLDCTFKQRIQVIRSLAAGADAGLRQDHVMFMEDQGICSSQWSAWRFHLRNQLVMLYNPWKLSRSTQYQSLQVPEPINRFVFNSVCWTAHQESGVTFKRTGFPVVAQCWGHLLCRVPAVRNYQNGFLIASRGRVSFVYIDSASLLHGKPREAKTLAKGPLVSNTDPSWLQSIPVKGCGLPPDGLCALGRLSVAAQRLEILDLFMFPTFTNDLATEWDYQKRAVFVDKVVLCAAESKKRLTQFQQNGPLSILTNSKPFEISFSFSSQLESKKGWLSELATGSDNTYPQWALLQLFYR